MGAVLIAASPNQQILVILAVSAFLVIGLFVMFTVLATKYYKRCPSNAILVIFGRMRQGNDYECLHGGARFIIPMLQDYRWLGLDPIRVEISGPAATDEVARSLLLPNVFNVAIGTEPDLMQNAAKRLLDRSSAEIRQFAEDVIVARLDRILAEQRSRPAGDADTVIDSLNKSVESNLNQVGLTLLNSRRA